MSQIVNSESTTWTQNELKEGKAFLQKMGKCQDAGDLPAEIFEEFLKIKKNISTEVVIFNREGKIYLRRRPSEQENSSEPFQNQLHSLGVTHRKNEYLHDTLVRLRKQELGNSKIKTLSEVFPPVEAKDPQRGIYLCRIFIGEIDDLPQDANQGYFRKEEIPWNELVPSHRDSIIPYALNRS